MIQESLARPIDVEAAFNPFPGLRPFEFHESHLFFGRDGQSERLIEKLSRSRFLAVVGTSGSGKSSLVRAGLLPSLLGGMMTIAGSVWHVALLRPGNDPIGNLAQALCSPDAFGSEEEDNRKLQIAITEATLRRGNLGLIEAVRQANMPPTENLLVIADQFEELFRVEPGAKTEAQENAKAAFAKLLLEAASQRDLPIYVVLTMRSDYLGDCAQFQDLPEAINEGQYLIPRMTREQRREAITGPVAVGGADITPRLVNRLLNDVGDNPDQLPILQHALMRAWDKWKEENDPNAPLDLRHYEAIGGLADALSRHADEAYDELTASRQKLAEQIFRCLTEKGADNREVRRPLTVRDICAVNEAEEKEVIAVIETFRLPGRSFLMPPAGIALTADSLIDISHESLIRNWERLRDWVEDEARCARTYRRLAETAVLYQAGEAGFWRDPDLQIALDWRQRVGPNEAWARRYHPEFAAAMSFLQASKQNQDVEIAARDREQQEKLEQAQALTDAQQQRLEEQARAASRLRQSLAVLAVLVLLVLVAAIFSLLAYWRADTASTYANEQKLKAEAASIEATNQKSIAITEKDKADKAAGEARKAASDAETQKLIAEQKERDANAASVAEKEQRQVAEGKEKTNRQLLYAANMNLAYRTYEDGNYSTVDELLEAALPASDKSVADLRDFAWRYLWRLRHLKLAALERKEILIPTARVLALSPNGGILAVARADIELWDVKRRELLAMLPIERKVNRRGRPLDITSLVFSPNGRVLAFVRGNIAELWETSPPKQVKVLGKDNDTEAITSLVFSPEGKICTTGAYGVKLWDIAGNNSTVLLTDQPNSVLAVTLSRDGKMLATVGSDNNVKLWDVPTQKRLGVLTGHTGVISLAFSPDGKILATGSNDQTVKIWDSTTQKPIATLTGYSSPIYSLAFSSDGMTLAIGSQGVKLWDLNRNKELALISDSDKFGRDSMSDVAFSPDNRMLVTAGSSGVKLWDTSIFGGAATLRGHNNVVASIAFSPDSRQIASGSGDKTVKIWNLSTRQVVKTSPWQATPTSPPIEFVTYSPNGKMIAVRVGSGEVKLWDLDAQKELKMPGESGRIIASLAFSPDSNTLALGGTDHLINLLDLRTSREIKILGEQARTVISLAFSSDGKWLASGGDYGSVTLWDAISQKKIADLTGHKNGIYSVAFSPDGKTLATGSGDSTAKLWDLTTYQEVITFKGHAGNVFSVAFSPDGKTLATGGMDGLVKLWSIQGRQEVITLKGHSSYVNSVAFSPDGKTLASASSDRTVKLWFAAMDEDVARQRARK